MAQLTINNVPDEVADRLRRRAELTGRTVEAEALDLLTRVEVKLPPARSNEPFGSALARRLAELGFAQDDWEALNGSLEAVRFSRSDSIHRWVDFSNWPDEPDAA